MCVCLERGEKEKERRVREREREREGEREGERERGEKDVFTTYMQCAENSKSLEVRETAPWKLFSCEPDKRSS